MIVALGAFLPAAAAADGSPSASPAYRLFLLDVHEGAEPGMRVK